MFREKKYILDLVYCLWCQACTWESFNISSANEGRLLYNNLWELTKGLHQIKKLLYSSG
jgi:hypothetical protein